jgi:hypothetical protein
MDLPFEWRDNPRMAGTKPKTAVMIVVTEMAIIALLTRVLVHPARVVYLYFIPLTFVMASAAARARWIMKPMMAGKKWFEESLKKWRPDPRQWG